MACADHSGSAAAPNHVSRSCDERGEAPSCAAVHPRERLGTMPGRFATTTDSSPGNRRLRFELILASVLFAVGLFLMAALIFWVGILVLGAYEATPGGGGMGSFYGDFFGD